MCDGRSWTVIGEGESLCSRRTPLCSTHEMWKTQLVAASLVCKEIEGKMWKKGEGRDWAILQAVLYILHEQNRVKFGSREC